MSEPVEQSRIFRAIIAWKAIKGTVLLLIGLALTIAVGSGADQPLHRFALMLREHVTARLAVETVELLVRVATPGHLGLTSLALGLDGTVGIVEAWLLHRRQRWAIWLVVIASSALVPWELYELVLHFRPLRLLLLLVNVAVVVYLGLQTRRHLDAHPHGKLPSPQ